MKIEKEIFKQWQTARTKALSEMLDNPDDCGIYPTSKFFNRIDGLFMGYLTKYGNSKLSSKTSYVDRLDSYKKQYDFNCQIFAGDYNIYVERDGVALFETGGHSTFEQALKEVLKWLKRVNKKK